MEQTQCSEMSTHKIQMPGNHPKERIQHSQHDESFKSKIFNKFSFKLKSYYRPPHLQMRLFVTISNTNMAIVQTHKVEAMLA